MWRYKDKCCISYYCTGEFRGRDEGTNESRRELSLQKAEREGGRNETDGEIALQLGEISKNDVLRSNVNGYKLRTKGTLSLFCPGEAG